MNVCLVLCEILLISNLLVPDFTLRLNLVVIYVQLSSLNLKISLLRQTRTVRCSETNKCISVGTQWQTLHFLFFDWLVGVKDSERLNLAKVLKELREIFFSRVVREVFHKQVASLLGELKLDGFVFDRPFSFFLLHAGSNIKFLVSSF